MVRKLVTAVGILLLVAATASAQFAPGPVGAEGTNPGGGISSGSGTTPIGFVAFNYCTFSNVPSGALDVILFRSCLSQAFQTPGLCLAYPYSTAHPTILDINGLYNQNNGQYCPYLNGGQNFVTVCPNGQVVDGFWPC